MKKKVHLIFKTHLDIGFTDLSERVVHNYFDHFIPKALALASRSREENSGRDRFIWTTGSWLIYEYLNRAEPGSRKLMERGIEAGDISWHALPFTCHSELMDASLFEAGLRISGNLDRQFGKKTIAAKMTDVPGHCRAIIPLLADAGITFLHLGVNPASAMAELPPLFNWRSPEGKQITVNYVSGYGTCQSIEGSAESLVFAHSGDNCGPPTFLQVEKEYARLREAYPDSLIQASTLNDFARILQNFQNHLPTVTGEIGDTWIHGCGTDPLKVSRYRQLLRLRNRWITEGRTGNEPGFDAFTEKLLLIPEHTWGMDEKTHLRDYVNYSRKDFRQARKLDRLPREVLETGESEFCAFKMDAHDLSSETEGKPVPSYSRFESSWEEQRNYISQSLQNLTNPDFRREAEEALAVVEPVSVSREGLLSKGFIPVTPDEARLPGPFDGAFCSRTGAIRKLIDRETGKSWCVPGESLGLFRYEVFSSLCYSHFHKRYNINRDWTSGWAVPDFTKPGLENVEGLTHRFYTSEQASFFTGEGKLAILLSMPRESIDLYGAPGQLQIVYTLSGTRTLEAELRWSEKAANRIPEALWFSFVPDPGSEAGSWTIDKMGCPVSPFEVAASGNRALHGSWSGIRYFSSERSLHAEALDTPLISPGRPRILEFDPHQPQMDEGFHFNLYNNLWGTNFPMWYEEDGLARFRLTLE